MPLACGGLSLTRWSPASGGAGPVAPGRSTAGGRPGRRLLYLAPDFAAPPWKAAAKATPPGPTRPWPELLHLATALPVAGLVDHWPAARAAAPGDAAGLPVVPMLPACAGRQQLEAGAADAWWLSCSGWPACCRLLASGRSPARCPSCCTWWRCRPAGGAHAAGLCQVTTSSNPAWPGPVGGRSVAAGQCAAAGLVDHQRTARAAAPGSAADLPAVPVPLACAGPPAARTLRGRRLVRCLVAELQRLASVLPMAGLWSITGTLPELLHLVTLQARPMAPWAVAGSLNPARPAPGGGRSAGLASALPVVCLVDHRSAARAAAPGAGAGLQGGAPASGLPVLATSSKPARPAPGGGRSAGLASALPAAGLVDHRHAA